MRNERIKWMSQIAVLIWKEAVSARLRWMTSGARMLGGALLIWLGVTTMAMIEQSKTDAVMVPKQLDDSIPHVIPFTDADHDVAFDFQRHFPSTQWSYATTIAISDPVTRFMVHEPSFCRGIYKQSDVAFSGGFSVAIWSVDPTTPNSEVKCEFLRRLSSTDVVVWVMEVDGVIIHKSESCLQMHESSLDYIPTHGTCPPWKSGLWSSDVRITPYFQYQFKNDVDDPSQRLGALRYINNYLLMRVNPSREPQSNHLNGAAYTPGFHENGYVETMVSLSVYIGIWCLSVHPAQSMYDEKIQGTRELLRWCGASEIVCVYSHCLFTMLYSLIVIVPPALYFGLDYLVSTTLCLYCLVCITSSLPSIVSEWRWMNHIFMLYSFLSFASMFLLGNSNWAHLLALNPSSAFLFAWPPHNSATCWGWNVSSETANLFLLFDAFWCTIWTLYIVEVRPSEVDGRSWAFPLYAVMDFFKSVRNSRNLSSTSEMKSFASSRDLVQIEKLTKWYPGATKSALSDLTVSIPSGSIYALIGRNGAGKSTLISILTGQISAEEYAVGQVCGYDIKTEMYKIKKEIGLCRQDDVVWDMLSPYQHIHLVSTLRGLSMDTAILTELQIPFHKAAGDLSGGMRRRLCIAMALIGNPKLVVLDEPCASLDPIGRQQIWSLLRNHCDRGGTILVTTQHVDEAAMVGDCIGIISKGSMLCSSDVDTLESMYRSGQTIITSLRENSIQTPEELLDNINIPGITSEIRGSNLYFRSNSNSPGDTSRLLSFLEENPDVGHITLNTNWLEDLFVKLTSDSTKPAASTSRNPWSRVPNLTFLPATSGSDILTQILVVFQIRIIPFKRSLSHVVQFSFALLILTVVMAGYVWDCTSGKFSFPQDAKLIVVTDEASRHHDISKHLYQRDYEVVPISPVSFQEAEIMSCSLGFPGSAMYMHSVGSVSEGHSVGMNATLMWLPTKGWGAEYHMYSIEYFYTIRGITGQHVPVSFSDPRTNTHSDSLQFRLGTSLSTVVALLQTTAVLLTTFDVKSDLLHNLELLGLRRIVFWTTIVGIDIIDALITCVFYFASLWIFGLRDSESLFTIHSALFTCSIVLFGICSSLFSRAMTVTFAKSVTAQVLTSAVLMYTLVSSVFPLVMEHLAEAMFRDEYKALSEMISLMFPASILRVAVTNTNSNIPVNWRTVKLTLSGFFIHIMLLSLLLWTCLNNVTKKGKQFTAPLVSTDTNISQQSEDNTQSQSDWVRFNGVSISYDGCVPALSDVSLALKPGECLGVLGPNGAGKSTLINLITKLYVPSSGSVEIRRPLAVCPQHYTLWDNLTGFEHISAYLLFKYGKSITQHEIRSWATQVAEAVQLEDLHDKLARNYTGGNKRKLQVILSLFSGADVILLDEPTSGMDPSSRVAVWECIRSITTRYQKSIILTTHVMSEAEAICSRIAIVVDSRIRRLGSPISLKRQHGKGFIITIQTPCFADTSPLISNMKSSFKTTFPDAVELPGHPDRKTSSIKYSIPMCNVSECFKIIHSKGAEWGYKSFSVSQTISLEQIFIEAAEAYGPK